MTCAIPRKQTSANQSTDDELHRAFHQSMMPSRTSLQLIHQVCQNCKEFAGLLRASAHQKCGVILMINPHGSALPRLKRVEDEQCC
jgi:hypothetical protein